MFGYTWHICLFLPCAPKNEPSGQLRSWQRTCTIRGMSTPSLLVNDEKWNNVHSSKGAIEG
jgi:hypothetical protein